MKILSLLLLCFWSCTTSIKGSQNYEITYPERLDDRRHKRDLSTATGDGHETVATFALKAFKNKWILDAQKNRHLFSDTMVVRQFKPDGSEVITKEAPEHCHYQGSIRGSQDSTVVLNTCNGLKGMIDDGTKTYHIEPNGDYKETGAHKIYSSDNEPEFDAHKDCGMQSDELFNSTYKTSMPTTHTLKMARRSVAVNVEDIYRPYLTTNETRYNEVVFVVDNGIYQKYNNNSKIVLHRVAALCNALDAIFQRINIRIVMSAIDIWTAGDRMTRYPTYGLEINSFGSYRKKELIGKVHHDNAQFLSHNGWGRVAGAAWGNGMCGGGSHAINKWNFDPITGPLGTVAHEMGHNFNFKHNGDDCKCLTPKGCFMGGFQTRIPGFTDCDLDRLKYTNDWCLYNVPIKNLNARCGNGIKEDDEECDCGTPEMCKEKDPCCLPNDCYLKPSSLCNDLYHSCCKDCQIKKQGTLCKAAQDTSCDVPEYCTGNSRDCPDDLVKQDGIACNRTLKLFTGNLNRWSVVMNTLSPRVEARYIRINPQYWYRDICMRTEIYGCSSDKDCMIPLGISNKEIPDHQMTASSSYTTTDYQPHQARLFQSGRTWCSRVNQKSEYLQIDLGKVHTIGNIAIQGRGEYDYWVTGFFLLYSQDGQRWTTYTESSNSYCYRGQCVGTYDIQCRNIWGLDAKNAVKGCYDKLNTEAKGYGTCNPATSSSCATENVMCGQIQCFSNKNSPVLEYGTSYNKINLGDSQCSAAVIEHSGESFGIGMVSNGTKCGDKKICVNYQCKSLADIKIKSCQHKNGVPCKGRGICTNTGICHCYEGYDTKTDCEKALVAQDGGYSAWSQWSDCTAGCNGGQQNRHRFCNKPFPMHGGKDCQGEREQEQDCHTHPCPRAHSCRHLMVIAKTNNKVLPDGIYNIYPRGLSKPPIKTFCDMSRDGGGWTLLVTSHTNTWTKDNVRLNNPDSPSLTQDYSILKYADDIKNHKNVTGMTFEYRLEAQERGRWGGIWEADRLYTFTATTNKQTNVELVKKFDNWDYSARGIEKRMPWISGPKLTTSEDADWGTITANWATWYPSAWIDGHLTEDEPENIWYWMREGPWRREGPYLPRSCMDIQMKDIKWKSPKDGVYTIQPLDKQPMKVYCDLTSRGGGWTLLATSKTHTGWTANNVRFRNTDKPSLDADYSILGVGDAIKDFDSSQDFFQYRIEADGQNQYGGIFDAPMDYTFTSTSDKQINIQMVECFNNINKSTNLATRMPRLGMSSKILLGTGSTANDSSGSIVYNARSRSSPSYLPTLKPKPGVVRYWLREGTRRSCFDIKVHGVRQSRTYEDGYYMIRLLNDSSYLPVFCDMKSDPGAYTLVVTSRHNSWKREQVPARNVYRPSLNDDYSILKYADTIKNLGHSSTFKYKLDAKKRGHWGGVWRAPRKYSFLATSDNQTQVTLLKRFDKWKLPSGAWWKNNLISRMPWFNAHDEALLTTAAPRNSYKDGSIIMSSDTYRPAYWIRLVMGNPGVIWYWVNEDDCDIDRKAVNGGLSKWSAWGKCETLICNNRNTQRRYRTCDNPSPRCGGRSCNPIHKTVEKRACVSVTT